MFLVTVVTPQAKWMRKVFIYLNDAESYCDYMQNCGMGIWSLEKVTTELYDEFAATPK